MVGRKGRDSYAGHQVVTLSDCMTGGGGVSGYILRDDHSYSAHLRMISERLT